MLRRLFARGVRLSSVKPTAVPYILSDIGEGINEVVLREWYVKEGDTVDAFDQLCSVEHDKANVDITAKFGGPVKKLLVEVGATTNVGKPLCIIETTSKHAIDQYMKQLAADGEAPPAEDETPSNDAPSTPASSTTSASSSSSPACPYSEQRAKEDVRSSPSVRHFARLNNVDITFVPGTGRGGRVTKEDVQSFMNARGGAAAGGTGTATSTVAGTTAALAGEAGQEAAAAAATSTAVEAPAAAAPAAGSGDYEVRTTGVRKAMAKSMTASGQVPQFGCSDEVELDSLMALRERLKPLAAANGLEKLTFMPFFIKAVSVALEKHPELNAHVNGDGTVLTVRGSHNIGVAMDSPDGLVVPNVKNCERRSVLSIAMELNRLMLAARAGKRDKNDLSGGTFTLSNVGNIGGTYMRPLLLPPEIAIGAIGKAQRVPRFASATSNEVVARNIMNISWSADHRCVAGADMVAFSVRFKKLIENPDELFLHFSFSVYLLVFAGGTPASASGESLASDVRFPYPRLRTAGPIVSHLQEGGFIMFVTQLCLL